MARSWLLNVLMRTWLWRQLRSSLTSMEISNNFSPIFNGLRWELRCCLWKWELFRQIDWKLTMGHGVALVSVSPLYCISLNEFHPKHFLIPFPIQIEKTIVSELLKSQSPQSYMRNIARSGYKAAAKTAMKRRNAISNVNVNWRFALHVIFCIHVIWLCYSIGMHSSLLKFCSPAFCISFCPRQNLQFCRGL